MTNFVFYANFLMLSANIIVFIIVMQSDAKLKVVKTCLLIAISLGTILNIGKLTWFTILFALAPGLMLFKKSDKSTERNIVH